jgi:hypothetical protein
MSLKIKDKKIVREMMLLFFRGKTHGEIAEQINKEYNLDITKNTVRSYSCKHKWGKAKKRLEAKASEAYFQHLCKSVEKDVKKQILKVKDLIDKVVWTKFAHLEQHPEEIANMKLKDLLDYAKLAEVMSGGVTGRDEKIEKIKISLAEQVLREKEKREKKEKEIKVESSKNRLKDVLGEDFKF